MTAAPLEAAFLRPAPVWVSIEGVNGVGKSHLVRLLGRRLGPRAHLLSELTDDDSGRDQLVAEVVAALASGRSFLRTGNPLTETMALLALKVRQYERVQALADPPDIVIEDRGIDTVAVYQAPILAEALDSGRWPDTLTMLAELIYETAVEWRPLPHRTVLIVDDLDECARRFADREQRPLAPDERGLLNAAAELYRWRAEIEPDRFQIVARTGRSAGKIVDEIEQIVCDAAGATMSSRAWC